MNIDQIFAADCQAETFDPAILASYVSNYRTKLDFFKSALEFADAQGEDVGAWFRQRYVALREFHDIMDSTIGALQALRLDGQFFEA